MTPNEHNIFGQLCLGIVDPEKRIDELKYRIEVCGAQLLELEDNVIRLKRLMAIAIDEKNKLELAEKGDASAMVVTE